MRSQHVRDTERTLYATGTDRRAIVTKTGDIGYLETHEIEWGRIGTDRIIRQIQLRQISKITQKEERNGYG